VGQSVAGRSMIGLGSLLLCVFVLLGCKHRLGWVVVPSAHDAGPPADADLMATPIDDETLTRWSVITPGYCSLSPGTPIWSSSSGENAPPLPRGRYCFASLLVRTFARPGVVSSRSPCRLEAAAAQSRLLPEDDGEVRLEEAPVPASDLPAWDRVVASVADCAPRRAPDRCSCPFAGDGAEDCVPALSGDLIAFGERHACIARRGDQVAWCWGDPTAFRAGTSHAPVAPTRVSPAVLGIPEALEELEAGREITCGRGASGRVWCAGAGGESVVRVSPDAELRAIDISLGGDVGCALGIVERTPGIGVFCRRFTSPMLERALPFADDVDEVSIGDGLGCVRKGREVSCAHTDTELWTATPIPGRFLTITLGGSYACGQSADTYAYTCARIVDGTLGGAVLTTAPATGLTVSADSVCVSRGAGLACANWAEGPTVDGNLRPVLTRTRGPLLTGRAGPGIVCGTPAGGDGTLVCQPIGDPSIGLELLQVGSRYSAAGTEAICPGP